MGAIINKVEIEVKDAAEIAVMLGQARDRISELTEIINLLRRGDCWCEMAIGNPMVKRHSTGCQMAQELFKEDK